MKNNIILYLNQDELFTFPIAHFLINELNHKYNFIIKLGKTSIRKKIKILLIIFFEGSILKLFKYYKNKISLKELLKQKNVYLMDIQKNKDFDFGISINYPIKIYLQKYNIYNFHLGNFKNQKGSFIFYYKKIYNWNTVDLTFHLIDDKLDNGPIIRTKTINVKNNTALDIISLSLVHKDFFLDSINNIKKEVKHIHSYENRNKVNYEPSFLHILSKFLKNYM